MDEEGELGRLGMGGAEVIVRADCSARGHLPRHRTHAEIATLDLVRHTIDGAEAGGTDELARVAGPVEELLVAFSTAGIKHSLPAAMIEGDVDVFTALHLRRFGRGLRHAASLPDGLLDALHTGRTATLSYDLSTVSAFDRAVLGAVLEIPVGEVRSYAWVARQIGKPRAVRAVGSSLGRNPVPVLIPCHRVVRSDGSIGGYGFGREMKRALLAAEGALGGTAAPPR